jgi:hypothetical protein
MNAYRVNDARQESDRTNPAALFSRGSFRLDTGLVAVFVSAMAT